jgi:glycosyltransferase involved in cell wall biosynthesis
VFVVSHAVDAAPTDAPFERRRSLLFVGAFDAESPNDDAIAYFTGALLPVLRARGCDAPLVIAGAHAAQRVANASSADRVEIHADVDDLRPLYESARVFVAPMRFAAGIPLKVIEAAANGVPVVATSLVARQLGWEPGAELLIGDEPAAFADAIASLCSDRDLWTRVRSAARARVARDYNAQQLRDQLQNALAGALMQVKKLAT